LRPICAAGTNTDQGRRRPPKDVSVDLIEIKESAHAPGRMRGVEAIGGQPMSFQQTLAAEHRACDAAFVKIEQAAHRADWQAAETAAKDFIAASEAHFAYEETQLFPALEAAMPMAAGPTSVMRGEHAQMRELFAELLDAIVARDGAALDESAVTLLLVMQQHNVKEENILYPMADRALSEDQLSTNAGHNGADPWSS